MIALPTATDFESEIRRLWAMPTNQATGYADIKAGDLHHAVGGYPVPDGNHRMPVCCDAMLGLMRPGDKILNEPPKGKGASLTIRYILPR